MRSKKQRQGIFIIAEKAELRHDVKSMSPNMQLQDRARIWRTRYINLQRDRVTAARLRQNSRAPMAGWCIRFLNRWPLLLRQSKKYKARCGSATVHRDKSGSDMMKDAVLMIFTICGAVWYVEISSLLPLSRFIPRLLSRNILQHLLSRCISLSQSIERFRSMCSTPWIVLLVEIEMKVKVDSYIDFSEEAAASWIGKRGHPTD